MPKPKPPYIVEAILCLRDPDAIYSAAEITDLFIQKRPERRFNRKHIRTLLNQLPGEDWPRSLKPYPGQRPLPAYPAKYWIGALAEEDLAQVRTSKFA